VFPMVRFLFVLFFCPVIYAQSVGGTIVGAVKDQSGAALPGVEISIRNTATGISNELLTSETGTYRAVNLQPGPYEVKAALPGFALSQRNIGRCYGHGRSDCDCDKSRPCRVDGQPCG
jgi:hypothetical protein